MLSGTAVQVEALLHATDEQYALQLLSRLHLEDLNRARAALLCARTLYQTAVTQGDSIKGEGCRTPDPPERQIEETPDAAAGAQAGPPAVLHVLCFRLILPICILPCDDSCCM